MIMICDMVHVYEAYPNLVNGLKSVTCRLVTFSTHLMQERFLCCAAVV